MYIHDFSRLARSTQDLLNIVDTLTNKGVHLVSNKENIDTSTPQGRLMLTMIAAINEFERANLLERQKEGIAVAKAECKYKGRKEVQIDTDTFDKWYNKYMNREINKSELAKQLGVSRPTLDKLIKGMWIDGEEDEKRLSIGNAFHTKEEAEFAFEKLKVIHELKQFTESKNAVWDFNECHYVIYYNCTRKIIDYNYLMLNKYFDITFATGEMARKAIEAVGEDRIKKYYFGVEE